MKFDHSRLSQQELLQRAQRISGGDVYTAINYLKGLSSNATCVRAAFATMLQFRDHHPAAVKYTIDRFGRLHEDTAAPTYGRNAVPTWARS